MWDVPLLKLQGLIRTLVITGTFIWEHRYVKTSGTGNGATFKLFRRLSNAVREHPEDFATLLVS